MRALERLALAVAVAAATAAHAQDDAPPPPPSTEEPNVVVTPPPTPEQQAEAAKAAAAPVEATAAATPLVAGFKKGEGFRLLSDDGAWKLRVGLQAAAAYQPTFVEGTNNWSSFRVPYARARVDGSLFKKWIRYWFSFEFSQFPPFLLDGYLEAQPYDGLGVRLGQIYTPISHHEYLGPQEILFPDWALVADYFWTGRDKGVQLFGETGYVDYYAGFYAGTQLRETVTTPGHFQLLGRVTVKPLGKMGWGEIPYVMSEDGVPLRLAFSAQGYWNRVAPTSTGFNPSNGFFQRSDGPDQHQGALSGEFHLQWDRFQLYSEFYARRIEALASATPGFWQLGWWAQANVTFFRRILDAAVRVNWINPDISIPNYSFAALELQLAWFIMAPYVTLKLRYAYAHQQDPGPAPESMPDLFKLAQQPLSATGNGHMLTLQLMAYF